MTEDHCSFQQLPFSKLFNTYTSEYSKLKDFYTANPFDENQVKERVERVVQPESKEAFVQALKEYHQYLGIIDSQQSQMDKFSKDGALAFVTGQQLGVYGGPLFTIYKTITTILLARKWEKKLSTPVVPVFWLADEDHDFEEIASIGIPDYDEFKKIGLIDEGNTQPVSVQEIKETIKEFESSVRSELPDTDFSEKLFSLLNEFYQPGKLMFRLLLN